MPSLHSVASYLQSHTSNWPSLHPRTMLFSYLLPPRGSLETFVRAVASQVAISAYTAKGTVVNEPVPVSPTEGVHFEHSSVPKSLHALFAPNAHPLTHREVRLPSLDSFM